MPNFEPVRLSRQLELVKITPIVQTKTSYNKHVVQYTESLETSFLSFRESRVIPITNHTYIGSLKWPYRWGWASPAMKCGLNMHKPVDRPMHEVIDELATDNELFAEKFLEGWQIMTNNGYFKVKYYIYQSM